MTDSGMADLILMAAALNAIDCWHIDFNSMDGAKVQTDCWRTIKELPAVDAVPVVHARWVEIPDRAQHYQCSECGVVWGVSSKTMRYCPNCGAKMGNCALWDMETEGTNDEAAID